MSWFRVPFNTGRSAQPSRNSSLVKASAGARSAQTSRKTSLMKASAVAKSAQPSTRSSPVKASAEAKSAQPSRRSSPVKASAGTKLPEAPASKPASPRSRLREWTPKTDELDFGYTSLQPFVSIYVCILLLVTLLVLVYIIAASKNERYNETSAEPYRALGEDAGLPLTSLSPPRTAQGDPSEAHTEITVDFPVGNTTRDDE